MDLEPENTGALNNLSWILATTEDERLKDPAGSIRLAYQACQLSEFEDPSILDTLAAAYACAGRFVEAAQTAKKALGIAQATGQHALAKNIQERLKLYKAGLPYFETE